jgi:hypothetical protein
MSPVIVMCARCRQQVQSITVTALVNGDVEFFAQCHGETETTTITRRQVLEGWRIAEAIAFKPPAGVTPR